MILAAGLLLWRPDMLRTGAFYTEKGHSLGVHVYHKAKTGSAPRRITGYSARIASLDTIQVKPVNGEVQSLALFSWDKVSGFSTIFPWDLAQCPRVE